MKNSTRFLTIVKYFVLVLFLSMNKMSAQSYQWTKDLGGFGYDDANAVCTDSLGNVYVGGGFSSASISVGTITIPNSSPGTSDVYVAKYTSAGGLLWVKKISSTGADVVTGICMGPGGDIYITGMFNGPVLNSGIWSWNNINPGQDDAYIVRLNSNGITQSMKSYGSSGSENITGCSYSKKTGCLYIVGTFGTPTLSVGNFTVNNSSAAGKTDVYLAKINNIGNEMWVRVTGDISANDYSAGGIVCDSTGNVYFGGTYNGAGATNIAGTTLTSFGGGDIFLAKYDVLGNPQWATDIGTSNSFDGLNDIGIDAANNILISGYFGMASLNIGSVVIAPTNAFDAFYAKYNNSGSMTWAKNIGGVNNQYIYAIDSDKNNNIFFSGMYTGSVVTIGTTTLTASSVGASDIFITKCNSAGLPLWTSTAFGAGQENANSIALDSLSNLYIVGTYEDVGFTNFGTTTLNTYGSIDVFIAKIGCLSTAISGFSTVCQGSSITLTAIGATNYTWSTGAYTPTISVSPTVSITYTVAGATGACVATPSSFTVGLLPVTLTLAPNLNLLCKQSSVINATCNPTGPSVNWTPAANLSNTNVLSPTVTAGSGTTIYTVNATFSNGCVKTNTISVTGYAPVPDICQVTVDSLGINNEIYWEKSLYTTADSFFVYREVSLNSWKKIASLSRTAFSMYVDTNRTVGPANGDPNASYYKYRLQLKDSCGNLSPMSKWHETIFIQDQMNGNFNWNSYAIESTSSPVSNYDLKRRTVATGSESLVISTVGNLATDAQYNTFWPTNVKWFVDAQGFNCTPSIIKNPKNGNNQVQVTKTKTKSNQSNDKLSTAIQNEFLSAIIKVYPNPASEFLNISVSAYNSGPCVAVIKNVMGQEIIAATTFNKIVSIDINDIPAGVYFVTIKDQHGNFFTEQKVIVSK